MAVVNDVDREETILYDLTIQAEWRQDPEPLLVSTYYTTAENKKLSRHGRDKASSYARATSTEQSSAWSLLRTFGSTVSPSNASDLPAGLMKLINAQINWKFALTRTGEQLAILQENSIEIRTSQNEFTTLQSKWNLASPSSRDPCPQWRTLAWSPDGSMLAISDSVGQIEIFDPLGATLCRIPPRRSVASSDFSQSLCSLIFKDLRAVNIADDHRWFIELLAVNYQGSLSAYVISEEFQFRLSHTFDFTDVYPNGVSSVVYHHPHSLLLVGGSASSSLVEGGGGATVADSTALCHGISAWRVLSGLPYFKRIDDYNADGVDDVSKRHLVKRFRSRFFSWAREVSPDGIFKLSLSPSGLLLASVHYSGALSLWDVPSLRLRKTWPLELQPEYDTVNEEVAENPKLRKQLKEHLHAFYLSDVGWWSDTAVVLARGNGAVLVSSIDSLQNLLGASPEWFEPGPVVTWASGGCFLGLECESKYSYPKRHLVSESGSSHEEEHEEDSDDELDVTIGLKVSRYVRQGLYYVTDSERFQPPRRKKKLVTRTYRLICLKSTTPEELYARKIDNEEYGEALSLAQSYQLDSDLVYQRQWRKSPVSVAAIQDYLSKIGKRSWVLHECLERVPEDFDAMNELLKYGLRGTDLEALIAIGKREDNGRFILCQVDCDVYHSLDAVDDDSAIEARETEERRRKEWLSEVDFNNLSLEQQELCRIRLKLLYYTDRLMTYQAILGGIHISAEKYDHKFFEKFRSQNVVELAVEYARAADVSALSYLFTYHAKETSPHRLAILSNFPETFPPTKYSDLLPEASLSPGDPEVVPWSQESWREPDWCEQHVTSPSLLAKSWNEDYVDLLYVDQPHCVRFRNVELSRQSLTEWYECRACEIESLSGQVDNALELVKLAMRKNVEGLDELLDDLLTMETFVYECRVDDGLSFRSLRQMSAIEKLRLMMSRSSEEMYLKNLKKWAIPFLRKCDQKSPGCFYLLLKEYLVAMAAYDLTLCAIVFKASTDVVVDPVIADQKELMAIALDCVYAYNGNDQLDKSLEILKCLPQRNDKNHSDEVSKLHDAVDDLENHLDAAKILQRNGLPQMVSFIRETQNNSEEATKLFTRIARTAARQQPPIGELRLRKLLDELCVLQEKVYRCITRSTCHEIFVESLLCSGCDENIKLAGRMIEHSRSSAQQHPQLHQQQMGEQRMVDVLQFRVAYEQSVQLVLAAAREYFDSSATLSDADMELARTCLSLIVDENPQIKQEQDLIEAVSMLEGFCVSILPVQVRMCSDKLQLVQKALTARPSSYKKSQRLLKLGKLLRVGGSSEAETHGQVLRLVAEAALKNNDHKSSYEACVQLMEAGYPRAWRECKDLAEVEEFPDIQAKSELLSFAVVHCQPDMIEPILRAKNLLQAQLLYEQIHARIGDRESPSSPLFSHKGALAQTKDILHSTNKATKSVLLHISDSRWWKKTLTGLRPARRDPQADEYDGLNSGFQRQSCHPFYEAVYDKCYTNKSEADYVGMRPPRTDVAGLTISEGLLRTAKLEEAVTEGQNVNLASQVLLQVAEDIIVQDSTLGLAYLLALPDATEADACFGKVPSTKISLQLAVYYYALQIVSHLTSLNQSRLNDFYQCSPHELTRKVICYVRAVMEQKKDSDWSADVQQMVQRMMHFNEVLLDYMQAQTLENLDRGVDISRFVLDDGYKKETILGMVLCLDDEMFKTAVSLATRHRVPVRDVYMAHLEFLFEENSLSTSQIESRIQALDILPELTKDDQTFSERMQMNVYPLINGTDHDRLVLFYTLLGGCSLSRVAKDQLTPQTHVKLLKKIKTTAPGLNYKELTSGNSDPLDVLSPVLNQDNVAAIAKLASNVNDKSGKPLIASSIYRLWACRLFWEGPQGKKAPDNPSDWIHRYELCNECISKMRSDDFFSFIRNITFTSEAVKQLPLDCRRQVLRRTLKHAKQQQNPKKTKDTPQGDGWMSWEEVISQIQRFLEHIDRLSCPFLQDARASSDPVLQNYALLFDLTCSESEKVEDLLVRMVLDGQSLEMVEEMRGVTSKIASFKLVSIVEKALGLITAAMKNPLERQASLVGCDLSRTMERIVSCTAAHQNTGGSLVRMNDIVNVLLLFCADTNVAAEIRLNILQILSQTLDLGPDDRSLVLYYQTQAKVSLIDNDLEVTEAVKNDEGRQALFDRLLSSCDRMDQLKVMTELLVDIWPELQSATEHADDPSKNAWCRLVDRFLQRGEEDRDEMMREILHLTSSLYDRNSFSAACASYVFERLLNDDPGQMAAAAKSLLLCRHSELYCQAVHVLHQLPQSFEDELYTLILKRHLVTAAVETAFYPQLVVHILSSQCSEDSETPDYIRLESVAKELQDAGYQAEAGNLVMQFRSTHRSLRTFDAAFSVLSRLFHRS